MARQAKIGRGELQVLQYVAEHHPITVGEAAKYFASEAGLARTTVLTVMERLRRKGYLSRKKVAGVFQYSTKVSHSSVLRQLVRDFVAEALGGSLAPFVAYMAEEEEIDPAQLAELKQLVRQLEQDRK
jgi:predicted transcriptional regulator